VVNGHQALHSRMGCSSSNVLMHTNTRAFADSSGKSQKSLLRASAIPVTPVLCASDQIHVEESNAWETCSCTSWEIREEHVVGDKRVPLPPSSRMHQKHKKRLDQFFEQVLVRQDVFKKQVAKRRSNMNTKLHGDRHFTQVATSIVPIKADPHKKCRDFSATDCHITPVSRAESSTTCWKDETLPGFLEF